MSIDPTRAYSYDISEEEEEEEMEANRRGAIGVTVITDSPTCARGQGPVRGAVKGAHLQDHQANGETH